jgi:CRP-like cAMP-binding protein
VAGQAGNLNHQATRLHHRGNLPEALELYTRALVHSPREVSALLGAAECLTSLSKPREAAPFYLRAVEVHANQGHLLKALFTLGQISSPGPQRQLGTRLLADSFAKKTGRAAQLRHPPTPTPLLGPRPVPLFSQLSKNAFIGLVESLQIRSVAEGEFLFQPGDPGDAMLILVSGRLAVQKDTLDKTASSITMLEEGSFFGERALLGDLPRVARVQAVQPSSLLVVSKSQVEQTRRAYPSWERALQHVYRENLLNTLMRTSELFAPLPGDAHHKLIKEFRIKRIPPKTPLFEEGQPTDGLYVVLEGRVEVVVRQRGRRRVLAKWEAGSVFGEDSLFGSPRSGHALRTGRKTTVLRLPRKSFTEVLAGFPGSWAHVQHLAKALPKSSPGGGDAEPRLPKESNLILV